MLISEIFDSIDGEGVRAGRLCTFIRVVGCNLRCSYCDSMYAVEPEKYSSIRPKEMGITEILSYVNRNYMRVTLTGGEPLLFPETVQLVNRLCDMGCEVNIETNGSCDVVGFRNLIRNPDRLFFTVDFKLPSSGEMYSMRLSNFDNLRKNDVLKFVIGTEEDLEIAVSLAHNAILKYGKDAPYIYCGTVFGGFELRDVIAEFMKDATLADVRFQIQMHKVIWDPNARGV
ncbi:MAG: radical SAM protein [Clostridia bacterium]|nr:radical SAM protein [Clostridia bacterium]